MESLGTPAVATASAPPPYLTVSLYLLYGFSAIVRSKILSTFAIAHGLYWLYCFGANSYEMSYLDVYMTATNYFGLVFRTIWATQLMDAKEFTRKRETKKDDDGDMEVKRTKKQLVLDSLDMSFFASRGWGWNWNFRVVTTTPPSPNTPRLRFIVTNIIHAFSSLTVTEFINAYFRHYHPIGTVPVTRLLTEESWYTAIPHAWLLYIQGRETMDGYHRLCACVGVATGIWKPSDWPPLFGSFKEAYTIRRFWGYTWHQMMRPVASPPTAFLAKKLGLPKNSRSTFYFRVAGAFFWAWALHAFGTFAAGGGLMADVYRYAPQILLFFVEEEVIKIGKAYGLKDGAWTRLVGYVWVAFAQGLTLVYWYDPMSKGGVFAQPTPTSAFWNPAEWILTRVK